MPFNRITPRVFAASWTILLIAAVGCSKGSSSSSGGAGSAASTNAGPASSFLTVDTYCTTFCDKLCSTCGDDRCKTGCKPRCYFGRAPDMVLDGKDPKIGLALTHKELDACLATITTDGCPAILNGQVPPACFTIQH